MPNDQFRPILDRCNGPRRDNRGLDSDGAASKDSFETFDLAGLDVLVERERAQFADRLAAASSMSQSSTTETGGDVAENDPATPLDDVPLADEDVAPGDFAKVIRLFIGLRKPAWAGERDGCYARGNWDRFCVLHVLVMAFINQFGYPWQTRTHAELTRAVDNIVDAKTIAGFARAIDAPLGFTVSRVRGVRRVDQAPMETVRELLKERQTDPALQNHGRT